MKSIRHRRSTSVVLFAGLALLFTGPAYGQDAINNSVVKIHVTNREPDFTRPWAKGTPKQVAGTGVIIEGERILTNAHVVNYAVRILVQGHQETERIPARLVAVSPEMDLALLEIDKAGFFSTRPALELDSELPKVKDTISAYGYPIGGEQLSVTEGIVSRIEYSRYNFGSMGMRIQVDAGLNPGNSGGPVMREGKVAGIVYSTIRSAENIGYVIPAEEVRLFLDDIADGTYTGKPKLVGYFQTVENTTLRQRLGLQEETGGLMVRDPVEEVEDYPLKPWDVITHVGPHPLDKKGNVRLEDGLNISFRYLLTDLVKEDKLPVTILREGEIQQLSLPVVTEIPALVTSLRGAYPRHFIFGPLTFTTASQDLIARINPQIQLVLKARKNPIILRQFDRPAFPDEELVILSVRMFPHPLVEGYDQQSFAAVHRVNEVDIKNLLHLVETIRDSEGKFLTIEFYGMYETMVLPRQGMFDSTEQILEDEGIRTPYSDDLRETWENRKRT